MKCRLKDPREFMFLHAAKRISLNDVMDFAIRHLLPVQVIQHKPLKLEVDGTLLTSGRVLLSDGTVVTIGDFNKEYTRTP